MNNKKLLTLLCLLSLTGCNMIPLSTTIEENSSSIVENNSSIVESSLEESSSSSIVKTDFDADTKALFDSYFSFNIPFIDLEYDVVDETSEYGVPCVLIYFYEKRNFYVDMYHHNDLDSYIYVQIYDKVIEEGFDGTATVDGNYAEQDAATIKSLLGFELPCVGNYYEIYYSTGENPDDSSKTYLDIMVFFNYTTQEHYDTLLSKLDAKFTYVKDTENSEGTKFKGYEKGDFQIYAGYKTTTTQGYPYIILEVYNPNYSGASDHVEFKNGTFLEEDAAFLNQAIGFVPACAGSEYQIIDYRDTDLGCVALYYYNVDADAYAALLEEFDDLYISYGELRVES